MKNKKIFISFAFVAGLAALLGSHFVYQPVTVQTEPIVIGYMGALTGSAAFIGKSTQAGIMLAADQVNEEGGVLGRPIEIIYEDSACDATTAATAAMKLINIDNVVGIIGALCSHATLAAAPIAEAAQIPLISYTSSAPAITDAGEYIFRVVPSDVFQAQHAARYLHEDLQVERVAILHCRNDYCEGNKEAFLEAFKGEVTSQEGHEEGATDLRTQIIKVMATNPEAVYFLGFPTDTVVGIKQMAELGFLDRVKVLGPDTWSTQTIWDSLGALADGVMYMQPGNIKDDTSFSKDILAYLAPEEISVYTSRAYDALRIMTQSINISEGVNGEDIVETLYELSNYQGVADSYSFDQNGDVVGATYDILQIQDGLPVLIK